VTDDKGTRRCTRCILPAEYPGISFDDEGVCNFCRDYRPGHRNLGREALLELLRSVPRSGDYDCVVPLSGGKDSTFILYYAVRELGLRPIAVSYDSGFQTDFARENVRRACETLRVPLVPVKAPEATQLKVVREWILLSERMGGLYGACGGNCEAILRKVATDTARDTGAPFVLWGSSALEGGDYAAYLSKGKPKKGKTARKLKRNAVRLGKLAKAPAKIRKLPDIAYPHVGWHALKFDLYSIRQRKALGFPWRTARKPRYIQPFTDEDPRFVHFFDYVQWDSIRGARLLAEEVGWEHPPGREARFDCALHSLGNRQHLQTHGISADGANFCNFIREGGMERDAALAGEAAVVASLDGELREVLAKVGVASRSAT
jgi:hypothetical protein